MHKKNKCKILYINHYAGSPKMGMEFRPYYLARRWVETGNEVKIVASTFSHLRLKNPNIKGIASTEEVDGISYHWLRGPRYDGNGIGRLLNIFTFLGVFLLLLPKWISFRPDIIIASSTYPLDVIPAFLLTRLTGAKLVHEIHDLWPLTLIELHGMSERHPFIVLLSWAERFSYRNVDYVVSMLPGADKYLTTKGLIPEKYHLVPNGYGSENDGLKVTNPFSYPGYEEFFKVGYAGYLGEANALDDMFAAAENLRDEKILFVLVGDGPLKEKLRKFADEKRLNVLFLPKIEKSEVPQFLNSVDACYIGWKHSELYKYGISPNKLLDYMHSAKPIIHATSAIQNLVQIADCGLTVEAENIEEIQDAIRRMQIMSREERRLMGERGRVYLERHLNFNRLADSFLQFVLR
ncbi:glycosyltransferase family 4 protein [Bdellovibrio sp. HCB-162]|uniref:glycosyltransferase family 4 protein n=1 Tax=Bdellovibrio sp. HCB-162 TaxID=3394234 RepID=UPI0039BC33FD